MIRDYHFFRMVQGVRTPVTLKIDDEMLIVAEEMHAPVGPATPDARQQTLLAQGVRFHQDGASLIIDHIPVDMQRVLAFFSEAAPCFFEGCEELRRQYQAERAANSGCPTCEEGALIRKYSVIVKGKLDGTAPIPNTRV